jgi:hypothetical protein
MIRPNLRRVPVVALEQSAKALVALDGPVRRWGGFRFNRPAVVQPLVRTFRQKMLDVLFNNVPQMFFAEEDNLVRTIPFGCPDPGLGK